MLGFEYILEVAGANPNQIADELKISRQSVYEWIRKKKIPEKRLDYLSKAFQLPREYFAKELTEDEMRNIKSQIENDKLTYLLKAQARRTNSYRDMDDLLSKLYERVFLTEPDKDLLSLKIDVLKKVLYLMNEQTDEEVVNLFKNIIDIVKVDNSEFVKELNKLINKYSDDKRGS
ncbi:helix-turn-helix domain-containing protein [Bacillus badius]|uniref:helix-turn-helix domain-containing protein n=1 Tax=Bacillus badius TaxID=1455 RepID=UPI000597318D|nr:helix-turn-helix domain-containing protein [Bacillus badius]KIL74339.1 hypothetical protein SD78_1408 [Bacillus badius]